MACSLEMFANGELCGLNSLSCWKDVFAAKSFSICVWWNLFLDWIVITEELLFSSLLFFTPQVQLIVDEYKAFNLSIANHCRRISETLLLRLDGKTVYR